jgi:hypothetical protein
MKRKLFNIAVYSMLVYSMINASYIALPVEYQEMIPFYNNFVAFVSAGASGLFGLGGLTVQNYLNKAREEADSKFSLLATNYLKVEEAYQVLKSEYKQVIAEQKNTTISVQKLIELVKVDLQAKLSNPLIDEKVKELIEGVIDNE